MTQAIIDQAIQAVMDLAGACEPFAPLRRGPLGAEDGISIALAPGDPPVCHLDRRCVVQLSLVLNAKHRDMQLVSSALHRIHDSLTRSAAYPGTEDWQITRIATETLPELIAREPDDRWLFASSLIVTLYY